ncbi:carbohydrate ABC transporter permease [Lacrimispora brassicae]
MKKVYIRKMKLTKIILTVIMGFLSVFMLMPLFWMISASFKVEADVFTYPIQWIPKTWNAVNNYSIVFLKNKFFLNYINSFIYSGGTVLLSFMVCSMSAYGFSKIKFKGRDVIFLFFLSLMMVPTQLTLIPRFMIIKGLNLYDSLLGLILMESMSIYGVFLLRQFMLSIPDAICESAKIDGANHIHIFFLIVVPLLKPAFATLGILKAVWSWNDYQGPLVFLNSANKFTVQLAVQQFAQSDGLSPVYSLIMAGAVISTIPLIVIFMMFQTQVIDGIAVGAVKG